jgi:hypothetical protein
MSIMRGPLRKRGSLSDTLIAAWDVEAGYGELGV